LRVGRKALRQGLPGMKDAEPLGNGVAYYAFNEYGEPEMIGFKPFGMCPLKNLLLEFFHPDLIVEHLEMEGYEVHWGKTNMPGRKEIRLTAYYAQQQDTYSLFEYIYCEPDADDEKEIVAKVSLGRLRHELRRHLENVA
jgi:hypothetical protein